MLSRFFQRRTVWWPTRLGVLFLLTILGLPIVLWGSWGESFLTVTERQPPDVLIVEGWIGIEGLRAAKAEFEQGGYRSIVTSGGEIHTRWNQDQWNYAVEARKILIRLGVPADRVFEAPAPETAAQRTFESAVAVRHLLDAHTLQAKTANVFTIGAHARRSHLIFAKALPGVTVGSIAWLPASHRSGPWWKSSERAQDLLKETVGYSFELLLNSGRSSNSPP